ncbi:hypothetical protein [Kordia zhangzhouensis]|uniref:hypothetical protein n=1 Tax=Kordia zhangzhouensis TaxID=1620405 RepID=UPI000629708E|nr:hypothetical protein [Kordia zhangzhouensis]
MEKRYFVLKKGYLNIDDQFFYFSNHGDWEACKILEETENPRLTFFYISNHIINTIYTIISITFLLFLIFGKITNPFEDTFIVLLLMSGIHLLNRRNKIQYFKIPLNKVIHLSIISTVLKLTFRNSKNQQISYSIKLDDPQETKDIQNYISTHFNHQLQNV